MSGLSATEVAYLMIAAQQAVLAIGWAFGPLRHDQTQAATRSWATYSSLSALAMALYVVGLRLGDEPVRAVSNLCIVASLIALHRGVLHFLGLPHRRVLHGALAAVAVAVSWLGTQGEWGVARVAVVSALLATLYMAIAWDVQAHWQRHARPLHALLLGLPLLLAAGVFGARCVRAILSPETIVPEVTSHSTLNLVSALVSMCAALALHIMLVALVVMRLTGELSRASRHDALTGLLNRRAFSEVLHGEAKRARRLGLSFTVMMIDVDHFKAINDTAGHAAGDCALQHLAALLSSQMRGIDRVCRWGGEEFVVLLPETPLCDAQPLAERLCECVALAPPTWGGVELPLTVSIGMAEWLADGDDPAKLLERADAALYRAKNDGRNRVVSDHGAFDSRPMVPYG